MRRPMNLSSASVAPTSRRSFSPSRAAALPTARTGGARHEADCTRRLSVLAAARADDTCRVGAPHLRAGAALLVRHPLILAAHGRAHLLAAGADADVGVPSNLSRSDIELCRQG